MKVSIFSLAKSTGETWFEHSKNTYHCGRVLWELCQDEISKHLDRDEYLWCCLFHDVGKMLIKDWSEAHKPYTRQALEILMSQKEYENLLDQFELTDKSSNDQLITIFEEHHNNKIAGSEWVTLADNIASSDYGYLSQLEGGTYSSYLKFLISDLPNLQGYNLIKITFPDSSYLDRVKFGQIFLTKMLRESVANWCKENVSLYLFDIPNGCKVLTKTEPSKLKIEVNHAFKSHLAQRFEDFDVMQLFIGGQPQGTFRLRQYVLPEKYDFVLDSLLKSALIEALGNIQRGAKIKDLPNTYEMSLWEPKRLFQEFEKYTNLSQANLARLASYDGSWLGHENKDKSLLLDNLEQLQSEKVPASKNERIQRLKNLCKNEHSQPAIFCLLQQEGIIDLNTQYKEHILEPFAKYLIRKNSFLRQEEKYPDLAIEPLLDFIAVNNQIPIDLYSTDSKHNCAACGTYKFFMNAGPAVTGFSKQQWRESIGLGESPQPLCPLCYFSLLIYTYLTGTEKGQNIRPKDASYLVLEGLHIVSDIESFIQQNSLFEEQVIRRLENLKRQFNLEETIVYIPEITDLDLIVYSIIPKNDRYTEYPSIQRFSLLSLIRDITQSSENILGVGLQEKPPTRGTSIIATSSGYLDLAALKPEIDIFNFVSGVTYEPKTLIRYFRLFQQSPALALSRLIKDSQYLPKERKQEILERGLKLVDKDENFELCEKLWQLVGLLGQMPTGGGSKYEVLRPLKKFKGTSESLDQTLNFLLKEPKCSSKSREEALDIYKELRQKLESFNKHEQKELDDYVKKTPHLFMNLTWQKIREGKGEASEQS